MQDKVAALILELRSKHKPLQEMTNEELLARAQEQADRVNKASGNLTGYDCPVCRNKGWVEEVRENGQQAGRPCYTTGPRECECMKIRKSKWLLKKSGLERLAARCTFDSFKTEEPWQAAIKRSAIEFTKCFCGFFFIGGQSGCGKTHICTAMALAFINQGRETRYMLWTDEAARIKACITDEAVYNDKMWSLKTVDVLYIDDLFKPTGANAQPTSADIRLAYEVINYRYNAGKTTIISSERTTSELNDIDEAIAGRIKEYSEGFCINIARDKAKNWRMK